MSEDDVSRPPTRAERGDIEADLTETLVEMFSSPRALYTFLRHRVSSDLVDELPDPDHAARRGYAARAAEKVVDHQLLAQLDEALQAERERRTRRRHNAPSGAGQVAARTSWPLVVRKESGDAHGTAWLVRDTVVVTAFHVVGHEDTGEWRHEVDRDVEYVLVVAPGDERTLEPLVFDESSDVALLTIAAASDLSPLALATEPPAPDDPWRSTGFAREFPGSEPTSVGGVIRMVRGESVQLLVGEGTDVSWAGLSGAPIVRSVRSTGRASGEVMAIMGEQRASTLWGSTVAGVRRLLARLDRPQRGIARPVGRKRSAVRTSDSPGPGRTDRVVPEIARGRISWLHISDLHMGPGGRWDVSRDKALRELKQHATLRGPPDLIAVTGDLSDSGQKAQFDRVSRALDEIRHAVGGDPVIIPVPGNHDLARPNPASPQAQAFARYRRDRGLRQLVRTADREGLAPIERWFEEYSSWLEHAVMPGWRRQGVVCKSGLLPGDIRLSFSCRGVRLGVVGVCSAFSHVDDGNYRGELIIERQQAGDELSAWSEDHHATLLLMHHPPTWLAEFDAAMIYPPGRFVAGLYGHRWESAALAPRDRQGRVWIAASSLFGRELCDTGQRKRPLGYVWAQLDQTSPTRGTLRIWDRQTEMRPDGGLDFEPLAGDALRPVHTLTDIALRDVATPPSSAPFVTLSTDSLERFLRHTLDTKLEKAEGAMDRGDFEDALSGCREILQDIGSLGEQARTDQDTRVRWREARIHELVCLAFLHDGDGAAQVVRVLDREDPDGWRPENEDRVVALARVLAQIGEWQRALRWLDGLAGESARATRQLATMAGSGEVPEDLVDEPVARLHACMVWSEQSGLHDRAAHEALDILEALDRQDESGAGSVMTRRLRAEAVRVVLFAVTASAGERPPGCAVVSESDRARAVERLARSLDPGESALRGAVPEHFLAHWVAYFHHVSWDEARLHRACETLRRLGEDDHMFQADLDDPGAIQLPENAPAWLGVVKDAMVCHHRGDTDAAVAMVEAELERDPGRPRLDLHRVAAVLYHVTGRLADAVVQAERAVAAFPGHGQKILLAKLLSSAGHTSRVWTELGPVLQDSPNIDARCLAARTAAVVEPTLAPALWQEIVESLEQDERLDHGRTEHALARLEWARSLAFVSDGVERAVEEAWRAYRSGGLENHAHALATCAELHWSSHHPQRDQRLYDLAGRLWTLAEQRGDRLASGYYIALWQRLGRPARLPEPDLEALHRRGVIRAVSDGEIARMVQTTASHQQRLAREYTQGNVPLERLAMEQGEEDCELFERVIRGSGGFRTPTAIEDSQDDLDGRELLLGSFELLLLDFLELLPELGRSMSGPSTILLFDDVFRRILAAPLRLASQMVPWQEEQVRATLLLIVSRPELVGTALPDTARNDGESEAEWARRHGAVLVRGYESSDGECTLVNWLRELVARGSINHQRLVAILGPDDATDETAHTESVPAALDFTALHELMRAGVMRDVIDALDDSALWITPQAHQALRAMLDEMDRTAAASARADRVRSWVLEMEREGRLEIVARSRVGLPPPVHEDATSRDVRDWLETSLQWRYALLDRPEARMVCMDALCAHGFTRGGPPMYLFQTLRYPTLEPYNAMGERLERVAPRVISIPALCRGLAGERYLDDTGETLIQLGFPHALSADELLHHAGRKSTAFSGRLRRWLEGLEQRVEQASLLEWFWLRTQLTRWYALVIGGAWCSDSPAENREVLTRALLDNAASLRRDRPDDCMRWLMKFLCAYVMDHPRASFVPAEDDSMMVHSPESPAGQMWRAIARWMTEQPEDRRRTIHRLVHEEAILDLVTVDERAQGDPDRIRLGMGPLLYATDGLQDLETSPPIPPSSLYSAIAILSALWPQETRPLQAHSLPVRPDDADSALSLEVWLTRAAPIHIEPSETISHDGVSFHVALESGGYSLATPPAALFLRLGSKERAEHATAFLRAYGASDGRVAAPLARIAESPDDEDALRSLAHRSILAPWQTFRMQPESIVRWGSASIGEPVPITIEDVRTMLSEPGPLPDEPGSLSAILYARVTEGSWRDRDDQLELLEMCGEIAGDPLLAMHWRISAETVDLASSLRRLGEAEQHPAARVAHDLLLCITATLHGLAERGRVDNEARQALSTSVSKLVEQAAGAPAPGSLAACEAQLLRHALWAVSAAAAGQRLSRRDGLWLTWRLYQWMITQLEALGPERKVDGWRRLAATGPEQGRFFAPRVLPDLLDPSRFGQDRLDIRLLAILHCLAKFKPEWVAWLLSDELHQVLARLRDRPLTDEEEQVKALPDPGTVLAQWGPLSRTVPELAGWILGQWQASSRQEHSGSTGRKKRHRKKGKPRQRGNQRKKGKSKKNRKSRKQ